jgi:ABC-type bacteriocin/lantibiotic exporter with double-glycine peptidase domain
VTSLLLTSVAAFLAAAEPTGIWLDVPFVRQEKNGCGPAAVAMVFGYWRLHGFAPPGLPEEAAVRRNLAAIRTEGLSAREMQAYFEAHGFRAFPIAAEWEDLAHHLAQGRPLIVALGGGSRMLLHYVVVAGIDSRRALVYINDPALRKLLKIDRRTFERDWSMPGRWTLLAVPGA